MEKTAKFHIALDELFESTDREIVISNELYVKQDMRDECQCRHGLGVLEIRESGEDWGNIYGPVCLSCGSEMVKSLREEGQDISADRLEKVLDEIWTAFN